MSIYTEIAKVNPGQPISYSLNGGEVSYPKFKKTVEERNGKIGICSATIYWLGRKVIALPDAGIRLLSVVMHVIQAIFSIITRPVVGDFRYTKVHGLKALRDFQAIVGRLISLMDDVFGIYLVQRADFYKQAYDACLEQAAD